MAHLSSRSPASRNQTSSPQGMDENVPILSQSPPRRTTRSTRGQSHDIGNDSIRVMRQSDRTRGKRQGSVESNGSIGNVKGRKAKKAPAVTSATLPIVAEDNETEDVELEDAELEDVVVDDMTEDVGLAHSPDDAANLSGTTALTSHSMQELADMNSEMIVSLLPDLYEITNKIAKFLLPGRPSLEALQETMKQIRIPGSWKARRLAILEETFSRTANPHYGSDRFINSSIIVHKIFGTQDMEEGHKKLDVILQAANISILLTMFLVMQQDGQDTTSLLLLVDGDNIFPGRFLSGYGLMAEFGRSALLEETFDMAISLRTQVLIASLKEYKDQDGFDPDELLAQVFMEPPKQRDHSISPYEDSLRHGHLRKIAGLDPDPEQVKTIMDVLDQIRSSFNHEAVSLADGDYVDFAQLEEKFPWMSFIDLMTQWARLRLDEIRANAEAEGGIESVAGSLMDKIGDTSEQVEPNMETSESKNSGLLAKQNSMSLSASKIIPASTGTSLPFSKKALQKLFSRRLFSSSAVPPSNQQGAPVGINRAMAVSGPSGLSTAPVIQFPPHTVKTTSQIQVEGIDNFQPTHDDEDPDDTHIGDGAGERSTAEILDEWNAAEADKNKENRPVPRPGNASHSSRRFVDRQANAERIQFSPEPEEPVIRVKKRNQNEYVEEETDIVVASEEISEDDGFQQDQRLVNPTRRRRLPAAKRSKNSPKYSPPTQIEDDNENDVGLYGAVERHNRRIAMDRREDEEEDDEEIPAPTPAMISVEARAATSRASFVARGHTSKLQKRVAWSEAETAHFVYLIESKGCSWAMIHKLGHDIILPHRDQVGLKDKARNLKVQYLKAGVALPRNFDGIALGRKEIEAVKNVGKNPYRLEGERIGEESLDMDGNPV